MRSGSFLLLFAAQIRPSQFRPAFANAGRNSFSTAGYRTDVLTNGFKMIAVGFTRADGTSVHVTDLKPEGYKSSFSTGVNGQFNIQLLSAAGAVEKTYNWVHKCNRGNWEAEGYWQVMGGAKVVKDDANDMEIPAKKGLYFNSPAVPATAAVGTKFTLTCDGAVVEGNMLLNLDKAGGFTCLANPYAADILVSSLMIDGYKPDFATGINGQFNIQLLTTRGGVEKTYNWVHKCNRGNWEAEGYWQVMGGAKVVPGSDDDLIIKAGEGFYFCAPAVPAGKSSTYTLQLTCPYTLH